MSVFYVVFGLIVAALIVRAYLNKKREEQFLSSPFDSATDNIGADFKGHSIKRMYLALRENVMSPRGEFETSAQFQQRLEGESDQIMYGTIRRRSLLAFRIPSKTTYDADKQMMWVEQDIEFYDREPSQWIVQQNPPWIWSLSFDGSDDKFPFGLVIGSRMDIATARAMKPSLGMLVICKVAHAANPTKMLSYKRLDFLKRYKCMILVEPLELWMYNTTDGHILFKLQRL